MSILPESKRERNLAALSHAGILFPGIGFAAALIVWANERSRSAYLRVQSLQALTFQFVQVIFVQLLLLAEGLILLLVMGLVAWLGNGGMPQNTILLILLGAAGLVFLLANLAYLALGIAAAIRCLTGSAWRYPWLGKLLEAYLLEEERQKENEGRLIASICHAGIFIPTTGLVAPLLVWAMQKAFSPWLHFHSLQAVFLQLGWLVVSSLLAVVEMMVIIPLLVSSLTAPDLLLNLMNPRLLIFGAAGGVSLINVVLFLVGPLLAVFATIAIVRILKGKDYHYPLFGKRLKERIIPA